MPVLPIGFNAATLSLPVSGVASGVSGGGSSEEGIATAIVSAAKGAVKEGKALAGRTKQALEDPEPVSALVLVVIGLLTLMVAGLGALLLVDLYKQRERLYR